MWLKQACTSLEHAVKTRRHLQYGNHRHQLSVQLQATKNSETQRGASTGPPRARNALRVALQSSPTAKQCVCRAQAPELGHAYHVARRKNRAVITTPTTITKLASAGCTARRDVAPPPCGGRISLQDFRRSTATASLLPRNEECSASNRVVTSSSHQQSKHRRNICGACRAGQGSAPPDQRRGRAGGLSPCQGPAHGRRHKGLIAADMFMM